ncbi:MAG: YwiC-like family protein [Candidatus Glassbacteria bacterium]
MSRKVLIPKEHGTWAMLLIPYSIGVAVSGGFSTKTIYGLVGVLMLFLSRPSLMILLKERQFHGRYPVGARKLWFNFGIPAVSGMGVFFWLFIKYSLWQLLLIGWVGIVLFLLYTWCTLHRMERAFFGQIVGILMLTFTTTLAVYISRGRLTREAFILWLLNALYFTLSVFYIKMRVRTSTCRDGLATNRVKFALAKNCLAYLTILMLIIVILILTQWVPVLVVLAFVPVTAHTLWGTITLQPKLEIMREGLIQTGLALIFAVLVIISYRI